MKYILNHIKNLYKGRLSRLDYFTSPLVLFLLVLAPILSSFGVYGIIDMLSSTGYSEVPSLLIFTYNITLFFSILFFLPVLIYFLVFVCGVIVRRGHDIGWSAWFSLFMYAIGQIIIIPLFFLFFQKSDKGENEYGSLLEGKYFHRIFGVNKIPRIVKYIYGFLVFLLTLVVALVFILMFSGHKEDTTNKKINPRMEEFMNYIEVTINWPKVKDEETGLSVNYPNSYSNKNYSPSNSNSKNKIFAHISDPDNISVLNIAKGYSPEIKSYDLYGLMSEAEQTTLARTLVELELSNTDYSIIEDNTEKHLIMGKFNTYQTNLILETRKFGNVKYTVISLKIGAHLITISGVVKDYQNNTLEDTNMRYMLRSLYVESQLE